MDNVYFPITGTPLAASGIVAYRESKRVAVRDVASPGFTASGVMFFIGLVNALTTVTGPDVIAFTRSQPKQAWEWLVDLSDSEQ